MFLNKKLYIFGVLLPLFLFNACILNDDDDYDQIIPVDAELVSFALKHASVSELAGTIFTIDQVQGRIYNYDSLTYETVINEKAIITYASGAGMTNLLLMEENDSTLITSGDSLDISKPLNLRVYAHNTLVYKDYTFQLNIHQMDPDSIQYKLIASNPDFARFDKQKSIYFNSTFYTFVKNYAEIVLYSSDDAIVWTREDLSGLPKNTVINTIISNNHAIYSSTEEGDLYVSYNARSWTKVETDYPIVTTLGYLNRSSIQEEGLCLIVSKEGTSTFAFTPDLLNWTYGNTVPNDFPRNGFTSICQTVTTLQQLSVIGGTTQSGEIINTVWSTQNGLYWAKITDARVSSLPTITGASAFIYDDMLCVINGQTSENKFNSNFYVSEDYGYTWTVQKNKWKPRFITRSEASVIVDNDGIYFYVLGGNEADVRTEVWRGFLNKKVFDH